MVCCNVKSTVSICAASIALAAIFAIFLPAYGCTCTTSDSPSESHQSDAASILSPNSFSLDDVPSYEGLPSVEVNGNMPFFSSEDLTKETFEAYSALDDLGRCGTACALVGPEKMPNEERGSIGTVRPSGWQIAEYDWVDGRYLFNRCHLIAFALAGENDNPLNLITGTRSMNVAGMLPYENCVASYVDETSNHVLYRVTPVFEGENLVASGVLMEAESVEDGGDGVSFCVWCYNAEPGVVIDYSTGESRAGDPRVEAFASDAGDMAPEAAGANDDGTRVSGRDDGEPSSDSATPTETASPVTMTYVLNTNSHRFHYPECPSVVGMKEKNRQVFEGTRDEALRNGYQPCGTCNP